MTASGLAIIVGRDERARKEEQAGVLSFESLHNDGTTKALVWLTQVKGVFSRGLPRMPVDYIARMVYDANHHSLCLLKSNRVIGGILYRPFLSQGFAEIVFLAIDPAEQVRGYGTHIMNHLKEVCKLSGIHNFLTYADNFAVGYFRKQGFSEILTLPRERYLGYIKDYDGGTLMECRFDHRIDFLRVPQFVQAARAQLDRAIRLRCANHVVHPGLTVFRDGKTRHKRIAITDIPGVAGTQYSPDPNALDEAVLHGLLARVLRAVKEHKAAAVFLAPLPNPDFHELFKSAIDLSIVQERLDSRAYYVTKDIFVADVARMIKNVRDFFEEDSELYRCANTLESFFKLELIRADLQGK